MDRKMASEAVLKYLVDTNRPYSCADVTVNLRGAYTKTVIQKTLDTLSESGKIRCKLYGKQKVYVAIQPDNVDAGCDVEDYDNKFKTLTQNLAEKSNLLKTVEISLKTLTSTPKTEEAVVEMNEKQQRIDAFETKIIELKNSVQVITAEEKKIIMDEHEKLTREYRKRKRMSTDMLEAMLEGYPKSKKHLIDELCIETDEMVNFKLISNTL